MTLGRTGPRQPGVHGNLALRGGRRRRDLFTRISIVNSTGSEGSYGHVLLVESTGNENNANFEPVKQTHADGAVWYGNKLFVADGGELQVYDFQRLWKIQTSAEAVGIKNGVSSARWHQWALPMVGRCTIDASRKDRRYCPEQIPR
ncbi:hypothetical protein [Streptomyces sp. NPDC005283]|uniref:hypothetical protein n=1 Tax=Streptomyces sp. NPDC005283 TaxID=3156871 RepID=UPI0034534614